MALADGLARDTKPALTRRPPPSLADKLRRAFWQVVAGVLMRPSPTPLHGWRRMILRAFGARIGARCAIYPTARIWAPWNLEIGEGATVGGGAILYNVDRIVIGDFAVVSQGAHLCTASHDHNAPSFDLITAPIVLGAEAWVAADAFIGPGVTLEEGAVAAARAVVVRGVPRRAIVAGNPARLVSQRAATGRNRLTGRSGSPH